MLAYYGTQLSPNQIETREGFLICRNVPIARIGAQEYTARDLKLDGDPERVIPVQRLPEDVFDPATLASFEGKPVTQLHPPELVGPENYAAYLKGHAGNIRRDGDFIIADLFIDDKSLASDIQNGTMREVSCGYTCRYEADGDGYKQTHIRGNHVAVVPRGRAGHEVAIKDAAMQAEKGSFRMSAFKKSIMTFLGLAAKDASPEELPGLIDTAVIALDAEPAEKAPEAAPAEKAEDVMVERAPKGDDLGSKLDKLIEMMESMLHKEDRMEKEGHDEDTLEGLIERLTGEKDPAEAAVIEAGEEEDACGPARDAALLILKKARPAIAAITDSAQRAKVTDALINAVKAPDVMGQILTATQDAARSHASDCHTTYEQLCADSKAAYDARNPHKKQEV